MESLRYNPPTKLDKAEFGSTCRVLNEDGTETLWVQNSSDSEQPRWVKLGDLLEKIFFDKFNEEYLVLHLLHVFNNTDASKEFSLFRDLIHKLNE